MRVRVLDDHDDSESDYLYSMSLLSRLRTSQTAQIDISV